jgi:hypothetical protein
LRFWSPPLRLAQSFHAGAKPSDDLIHSYR